MVEFWNEYGVPEIDVLIVGFDCLRGAHDQDPFLRTIIFLDHGRGHGTLVCRRHLRDVRTGVAN